MKDRELGMNRPITRRDFVGGVAVAISGSLAWQWSEAGTPVDSDAQQGVLADSYPPIRSGMRGSHEGSYGRLKPTASPQNEIEGEGRSDEDHGRHDDESELDTGTHQDRDRSDPQDHVKEKSKQHLPAVIVEMALQR